MSWYFGDSGLRCAFTDRERAGTFDRALANLVFASDRFRLDGTARPGYSGKR